MLPKPSRYQNRASTHALLNALYLDDELEFRADFFFDLIFLNSLIIFRNISEATYE